MRLTRSLVALSLIGSGLLHCSSDGFTTTDSGTDDASNDASTTDGSFDDVARDVANDAPVVDGASDGGPIDSGPPAKCDPKKPFATPTKVLRNGLDVVVDVYGSFRIDAAEKHGWLQQGNLVRQYDISGTTITHDATIADLAVEQGFAVGANGLDLVVAHPGGVVHHTRANVTSNWGTGTLVPMPFNVPDGAAYQQFYYPYLSGTPTLYVSRFVYYPNLPSEWDVARVVGDAGTIFSELHAGNFAFASEPVLADDVTMYIARWGPGPVPHLVRTSRQNTAAAWGQPQDVVLGSLAVSTNDALRPYAVTPDDCTLYVGYAQSVDGSFALGGPFVLYVARRPL